MVAETHTSFADLERSAIIEFIVHVVAQVDEQIDVDELTLQRCGFTDDLEIEQLARIVGEEFSERTLVGQAEQSP